MTPGWSGICLPRLQGRYRSQSSLVLAKKPLLKNGNRNEQKSDLPWDYIINNAIRPAWSIYIVPRLCKTCVLLISNGKLYADFPRWLHLLGKEKRWVIWLIADFALWSCVGAVWKELALRPFVFISATESLLSWVAGEKSLWCPHKYIIRIFPAITNK